MTPVVCPLPYFVLASDGESHRIDDTACAGIVSSISIGPTRLSSMWTCTPGISLAATRAVGSMPVRVRLSSIVGRSSFTISYADDACRSSGSMSLRVISSRWPAERLVGRGGAVTEL